MSWVQSGRAKPPARTNHAPFGLCSTSKRILLSNSCVPGVWLGTPPESGAVCAASVGGEASRGESEMPKTVVLGTARTPFGKLGGGLSSLSAMELGGKAIEAALERAEVKPDQV